MLHQPSQRNLMMLENSYKVFKEISTHNGAKMFVWYRMGTDQERRRGKHIVPDVILEPKEHWKRMKYTDE